MILKKSSTAYARMVSSAVIDLFWDRPKSKFGEHLVIQASNNIWRK